MDTFCNAIAGDASFTGECRLARRRFQTEGREFGELVQAFHSFGVSWNFVEQNSVCALYPRSLYGAGFEFCFGEARQGFGDA